MTAIQAYELGKTYPMQKASSENFDALKDVSFRIDQGESVGIVGRNGAGKSTLLKILSGIVFPSYGKAEISGSFSSLIEVGTGFHPDLTGRENIFLNGSIIGIPRKEIKQQLDTIIAFSGVEDFIDEPLRTYSSGMKLRLAFSVIAHLKTDIIALDEVLAVGDSMFQIKCLNRIFDFKKEGKTILFVSHNMSAIRKLCDRSIVLDEGQIVFDGATDEAIDRYLKLNDTEPTIRPSKYVDSCKIDLSGNDCEMAFELTDLPKDEEIDLGININTSEGQCLYHFSNRFIASHLTPSSGSLKTTLRFKHQLKPGRYPVSVYIGQEEKQLEWNEHLTELVIGPSNPHGFHNPDSIQGPIITDFTITAD